MTRGIVAAVLAVAALPAASHAARPPKAAWTASYAESIVRARVHVPCSRIYPGESSAWQCDVTQLQAEVRDASDPAKEADCQGRLDPTSVSNCETQLAQVLGDAQARLRFATSGWPVDTVSCFGVGRDVNVRYARFSCKVALIRAPFETGVVHDGTIALTVTGRSSFRWQFI